ncbi:exonuclease domain-containing protein [Ancylobacter oerskovii]|uniref:Exonuclease domain-containing protein n=1 Tax=Ancylobacter oerskovii TaxID=459519 RepID=A0ABW4Z1F5_9HYPH
MIFPTAPAISRGLQRVIVLDTETTGLSQYDKIITLAALRFEGTELKDSLHHVYDPRKDSHPGALAVHGWDDWTLRFQDLFAETAEEVRDFLLWGDRLVAHNAEFDMRYVEREIRKAGLAPLDHPDVYCTMERSRRRWSGSAKLDLCLDRIGLQRAGARHGAYEDAFLTSCLYFNLQGSNDRPAAPITWPAPTNLRPAPPRPDGTLPRRTPKRRRTA